MIERLDGSSRTRYVPRPYGPLAAQWLVDHPRGMFIADPGLGKTVLSLQALDILTLLGSNVFPALVLAPKRVADVVWTREIEKWDFTQDLSVIKVMGEKEIRLDALRRSVADIYVANYDIVPWLVSMWPQERWPFKIVVADESSRLKGFRLEKGRVRAGALGNIAQYTERWWNLTGTPMPNGEADLWGQMYFVDFGERLKRNYTAFSEAYLMENPYTHKISTQLGAAAVIHEKIKDVTIAFRAKDWLNVKEPQLIPVEFELPQEAMAKYLDMERDFFLEVDEAQITAGTAMVKSMKLLQITSGSVYDTPTQVPHRVHDARLEALDSVLEQTGSAQVLVSYWFKPDVQRILQHLEKNRIRARVYSGTKDEDDWNAGKYRVLLLQEQSAFGLNLHVPCRDIFHYTYTWSGELWTQMIERVGPARQEQAGKKDVVRVWYAKAVGTIDNDVVESNFGKITAEEALKRARARRLYEKS